MVRAEQLTQLVTETHKMAESSLFSVGKQTTDRTSDIQFIKSSIEKTL